MWMGSLEVGVMGLSSTACGGQRADHLMLGYQKSAIRPLPATGSVVLYGIPNIHAGVGGVAGEDFCVPAA